MKQCIKCSVDLVLGENQTPSRMKRGYYICKSCFHEQNKKYLSKPKNKDKYNAYMRKYYKNNKTHLKLVNKNIKSINPGIYGIYNGDELIYIGESKQPYDRMTKHFTRSKKYNYGPVSQLLTEGELQRDKLRFKMLEFIDDTSTRKQQEALLIQRYKPLYNSDMYSHIHTLNIH